MGCGLVSGCWAAGVGAVGGQVVWRVGAGLPLPVREVCAPPELRTIAEGLVLAGAVTAVEVSVGDALDGCEAVVCDPVVEVCAPPELLTVPLGADAVPEVGAVSVVAAVSVVVEEDVEVVEVVESASVGSAQAMPWVPATAAPTPRAAANTPTRPMYSA